MFECDHFSSISAEFSGLDLPDARFGKRVQQMASQMAAHPGASFSAALGTALRKSAHRLFGYQDLDLGSTHRSRTTARIAAEKTVLLVEDTTDLVYRQSNKTGMGPLGGRADGKTRGLNLHSALALSTGGLPLGIVSHHLFAPSDKHKGSRREHIPIEEKESYKWIRTTAVANELAARHPGVCFIKVGDREADFYQHYSHPRSAGVELLVRLSQKKRTVYYEGQPVKVGALSEVLPVAAEGLLSIKEKGKVVERKVCYRFGQIWLPPSGTGKAKANANALLPQAPVRAQVVTITTLEGPAKDALEWLLLTTLPLNDVEDCVRLGRYYALRWTMERYHFILKSGLGIEQTQLQDAQSIGYALWIWAVVGWWVLLLYRLGRLGAEEEASAFFEAEIIEVLQLTNPKIIKTVADVVRAVGVLGGFQPSKKQPMPGEKTLWTGVRLLAAQTKIYLAAKQKYGTG